MTKASVVIPAYNVDQYLGRCLESLAAQTLTDFEAIVVDDASPDRTGAIADEFAASDPRFKVIHKPVNEGLHLARKTGVEAIAGEYAFLLDGDDEFEPTMLERVVARLEETGADIVHTGVTFFAENGVTEAERKASEDYANRPSPESKDDGVALDVFDEEHGQLVDWRVTQRAYRTPVLKAAFDDMVATRLERAEDGYEGFVLTATAKSSAPFEECRGYVYHYGIGVTGASVITADHFDRFCAQFAECLAATREYVDAHPGETLERCYAGMRHKMLELLANDLLVRVDEADWPVAAASMSARFGHSASARELWRFVRDDAYSYLAAGRAVPTDALAMTMRGIAEGELAFASPADGEDFDRALAVRDIALDHIAFTNHRELMNTYSEQDIRILVTTHKSVDVPDSEILQPIQVGPGNKSEATRFPDSLHDDEGDNIAELNPMYCEMTTQYWAWKNIDCDYVGFCHYRRYFNFASDVYEENPYGEVMDDFIDADAVRRYGLDDVSIARCVEGYDVITTGVKDLREFPGDFTTPREQYAAAEKLHIEDLERMERITKEMYPDYAQDVEAFLDGHFSCFCNMYIMRKPLFDAYCEWVFPILSRWVDETDMTTYSTEAMRTPGHLTERLFNIYRMHAARTGAGWKTKQLQCIHFENPERREGFVPMYERDLAVAKDNVVPVVFAADNNYVPVLTVAMGSMLRGADPSRNYEVVVLHKDISGDNQRIVRDHLAKYPNASVAFFNVGRMVKDYKLDTNNAHISVETYYRFLVQQILSCYDKVVYLDSDLVVRGDVAELFDTEMGSDLIAATRDVDYLANLNVKDGDRMEYTKEVLKMENPYDYFQAGVLVLNTTELRRVHTVPEWLKIATNPDFIYNDQDILNAECEGRVTFLPGRWNVTNNIFGRVDWLYPNAPSQVFADYNLGRCNPQVVHYAGAIKPWGDASIDMAGYFWDFARDTPFYERLVEGLSPKAAPVEPTAPKHERAVGEESPLRAIVDPIAPVGSRRREALKAVGRTLRGRK